MIALALALLCSLAEAQTQSPRWAVVSEWAGMEESAQWYQLTLERSDANQDPTSILVSAATEDATGITIPIAGAVGAATNTLEAGAVWTGPLFDALTGQRLDGTDYMSVSILIDVITVPGQDDAWVAVGITNSATMADESVGCGLHFDAQPNGDQRDVHQINGTSTIADTGSRVAPTRQVCATATHSARYLNIGGSAYNAADARVGGLKVAYDVAVTAGNWSWYIAAGRSTDHAQPATVKVKAYLRVVRIPDGLSP